MNVKIASFGTMWVGLDGWWQELDVTCYQLESDESRRFSASGMPFPDSQDKDRLHGYGPSPQDAVGALLQVIAQKRQPSSPSTDPSPPEAR